VQLAPGVLRRRDFALVFGGQCVSVVGDRLTPIALAFAVLGLTGSTASLGLVLGAATLGLALFILLAGVVADRVPRRRVVLASDLVRGVAQAATAALLLAGRATVPALAALGFVYGAAEAFHHPALIGLIPQVVEPAELQSATALMGLTFGIGGVVGPAVGGAAVALLGPGGAIGLDAATFLISAASLALVAPHPAPERAERRGLGGDLVDGVREARSRPWIVAVLGAFSAYHLIVLPGVFVLGPALARSDLAGASSWAAITAGFGVGGVVARLVALSFRPRRPVLATNALLAVAACQPAMIASGAGTVGIAALEAVAGVAVGLLFTFWDVTLQVEVPAGVLSRVSSLDFLASTALMPLGMAVVGPLAERGGLRPTMVACSLLGIAAAAVAASRRSVRLLTRPGVATSG
jgi:MFS family permease